MRLRKTVLSVFVFLLCFVGTTVIYKTVKSEENSPNEEVIEDSVKAQEQIDPLTLTEKLAVESSSLIINDTPKSSPVLFYNDRYYVPFDTIKPLQHNHLYYTPFLETIVITQEDKEFHLTLLQPDHVSIDIAPLNKIPTSGPHALMVNSRFYLPLSFIETQLQYEVEISKKENVAITIDYYDVNLPLDVPLINQMSSPRLYNGCEVTSLAMILQYHEINVTKNQLAADITRVPLTYSNGLKGNPNDGFVGDMENGPGLGVHHGPMLELARKYVGDRAIDLTGDSIDSIYSNLDKGLPVWVITTTRFAPVANFATWKTPSGNVDVTFSVHSVAVTGYDTESVYINDPYGMKNRKVNRQDFEDAWVQMGRQAIVITR